MTTQTLSPSPSSSPSYVASVAATTAGTAHPNDDSNGVGSDFGTNLPFDQVGESKPSPAGSQPDTPATEHPPNNPRRQDVLTHHDRPLSAIRLRRLRTPTSSAKLTQLPPLEFDGAGRRRSSSEPQRPTFPRGTVWTELPSVYEAPSGRIHRGSVAIPAPVAVVPNRAPLEDPLTTRRRRTVQNHPVSQTPTENCYDSKIVDLLDVIDPEVATLSSITNIQNSLFVPSLGKWVNRRPTYDLSLHPPVPGAFPGSKEDVTTKDRAEGGDLAAGPRSPSLSSVLSQPQYAILPKDASLEGWLEEDIKLLNDYVRHMLHSRRSKIKQRLKAFVKYTSQPLGFLVTLYATLITLFGLAWVLFLIGWIYVGDRQLYVINVIDYVLVALFAIVGDGLAPFRAIDTYHMTFVAHYHRKTWKMREKLLLPALPDHNDLPTAGSDGGTVPDLEARSKQTGKQFFPVLSDKEQAKLEHHQAKLAKSHTFYKPHETETHRAFPLRLLIAIVLLLDLHSCLQIALGACTWGISYEVRPFALTTTILSCSIATNIAAGVLISIGDRRTRKKDVLDRLLKQDLTKEVMRRMQKKKEKEARKDDECKALLLPGGKRLPSWAERKKKSSEKDRGNEASQGEEKDAGEPPVPGALPSDGRTWI
ncbi:hypothetical protein VTK26DRAFT_6232 [Humicola hyalothermophila]